MMETQRGNNSMVRYLVIQEGELIDELKVCKAFQEHFDKLFVVGARDRILDWTLLTSLPSCYGSRGGIRRAVKGRSHLRTAA